LLDHQPNGFPTQACTVRARKQGIGLRLHHFPHLQPRLYGLRFVNPQAIPTAWPLLLGAGPADPKTLTGQIGITEPPKADFTDLAGHVETSATRDTVHVPRACPKPRQAGHLHPPGVKASWPKLNSPLFVNFTFN
jgi:hypothetical protein